MDAVLSDPVIQGLLGSGMLCKDELSPFLIFQSLSLHRCMAWKAIGPRDGGSDSDPDCRWGIRKRSHLGQSSKPASSSWRRSGGQLLYRNLRLNRTSEAQPRTGQSDCECELLPDPSPSRKHR